MPRGPRKFQYLVGKTGLTRFGGLGLFQSFCKSLRLRYFLQHQMRWPSYSHRGFHPVDIFLAHLFAIVAGIGRIENTQSLIHNGLIPPILGLSDFPHRNTLRKFLWRFNYRSLANLQAAHNKVRKELFQRLGLLYSAVIDADTTAIRVYGRQEGTAIGYIPKLRHSKPSYSPILSSEGRTGLSLAMELRAGNVHATTGAWQFLKEILDQLPSSIAQSRIRFRLDGAFYDRYLIQKLDEESLGYVIVAKMTEPLKTRMISAHYRQFAEGWEAAHFTYPVTGFKKEHHFAAVRRPIEFEPEEVQRNLFTTQRHTYHRALVLGNLDLQPEGVWRFYCDRAFQELLLREFKDAMFMAKIPTHSFWANATYMEMILWAYDLVLAFQNLCLPKEIQDWNISTLRRELWWIAADWVRRDKRNILWLPAKYPHLDLILRIQKATEKVKPLI